MVLHGRKEKMRSRFKNIIKSERPVLVDFYAAWCEPCKEVLPILKEVKGTFRESIRIIKVDVDKNPFIASHYQVKSIPTLMLFKQGAVQWTCVGMVEKSKLTSAIKQHVIRRE
jgi:thioredoxin 1